MASSSGSLNHDPTLDAPGPTTELPAPATPAHERADPNKPANRPFLAYKKYRAEQVAEHQAWEQRSREREAKIARGENVGPLEPDPDAVQDLGVLSLLKLIVYFLIIFLLAGKFFTGDWLWEYRSKWMELKSYLPANDLSDRLLSEENLATYDGSTPGQPIFLAIDGVVYDVSSNPETYGPGGSYHFMAGIDAARAFATGCFKTHRTHDLRELTDSELQGLEHWKKFYAEHQIYTRIGRVVHRTIDPTSPIPEPCDGGRGQKSADPRKSTKEDVKRPVYNAGETKESSVHKEL